MKPKKQAFTDASQLGEMNRTVWKTLGGNRNNVEDAPPETGDTVPTSQNTTMAGNTGANATDIAPTTE